jgi:hypothetical protein
MEINPYESPATPDQSSPPDNKRAYRWIGTLLIGLAIVPYVPMTLAPFLALASARESPLMMIAAGTFNGCVCVTLFFSGRWLRRKGRRPLATDVVDRPG